MYNIVLFIPGKNTLEFRPHSSFHLHYQIPHSNWVPRTMSLAVFWQKIHSHLPQPTRGSQIQVTVRLLISHTLHIILCNIRTVHNNCHRLHPATLLLSNFVNLNFVTCIFLISWKYVSTCTGHVATTIKTRQPLFSLLFLKSEMY